MKVESVMSLVRLSGHGDLIVANLAKMMLVLVQTLREFELRAGLAEAALEAERAKKLDVRPVLERLCSRGEISVDEFELLSRV